MRLPISQYSVIAVILAAESAVGGLGFTKYLESGVSKIGQTAKLQCTIHSDGDAPQVAWSVSCLLASLQGIIIISSSISSITE